MTIPFVGIFLTGQGRCEASSRVVVSLDVSGHRSAAYFQDEHDRFHFLELQDSGDLLLLTPREARGGVN